MSETAAPGGDKSLRRTIATDLGAFNEAAKKHGMHRSTSYYQLHS